MEVVCVCLYLECDGIEKGGNKRKGIRRQKALTYPVAGPLCLERRLKEKKKKNNNKAQT